jgi:hypothetical protein
MPTGHPLTTLPIATLLGQSILAEATLAAMINPTLTMSVVSVENKKSAIETITRMIDEIERWRDFGYDTKYQILGP